MLRSRSAPVKKIMVGFHIVAECELRLLVLSGRRHTLRRNLSDLKFPRCSIGPDTITYLYRTHRTVPPKVNFVSFGFGRRNENLAKTSPSQVRLVSGERA